MTIDAVASDHQCTTTAQPCVHLIVTYHECNVDDVVGIHGDVLAASRQKVLGAGLHEQREAKMRKLVQQSMSKCTHRLNPRLSVSTLVLLPLTEYVDTGRGGRGFATAAGAGGPACDACAGGYSACGADCCWSWHGK